MPDRKPVVIMRKGKTERDLASGAPARSARNHEARAAWNRTVRGKGSVIPRFPIEVCNGRETRALRFASKRVKKGGQASGILRKA